MAALSSTSLRRIGYALHPASISRSRDIQGSLLHMAETYPGLQQWVDSLQEAGALSDLYLPNEQGEMHHALYVPAVRPTRRTAVKAHCPEEPSQPGDARVIFLCQHRTAVLFRIYTHGTEFINPEFPAIPARPHLAV